MIDFLGKQLANPLIASSCIATESVANILRLSEHGVQGAIMKSCADYQPRNVSEKRQFAVGKDGYTYASSPFEKEILTLEQCVEMLQELRTKTDMLLIPSFTAKSLLIGEWVPACQRLEKSGADAIQLDFFYMGNLIGCEGFTDKIVELLKGLKLAVRIPIMPKLNVNLPKDFIMPLLVQAGIEYVSLLDSVRSPYLEKSDDGYCLSERLNAESTSCFGTWQLPLTLSYTYTAAKYGLKVCAGGGISCADDVEKLLAVGAITVQSATFLTKYPTKGGKLTGGFGK